LHSRTPSARRFTYLSLGLGIAVAGGLALTSGGCGGGGRRSNPPLPQVVIDAIAEYVDVGQLFRLDASRSTDPNGDAADLEFQWRIIAGGDDTDFDDHCNDDFDQICETNNDPCSNDENRICNDNDDCTIPGDCVAGACAGDPEQECARDTDCTDFGVCLVNTGSSSPDCATGLCGIGEGDEGPVVTFRADVPGPFRVRVTAIGERSNGTGTIVLNTFPSLYVVGSVFAFGGTQGALIGELEDAEEFAEDAIKGVSNPEDGSIVLIDEGLGVLRVFDLETGEIRGSFGEADSFVEEPAALAFRESNGRLYVAEADGDTLIFDGTTGLLISEFGDVGNSPDAMVFSPVTGDLLVVNGQAGSGVRAFGNNGNSKGTLGDTAAAVDEPVDLDFLGDPATDLLIADAAGGVVRCDVDGTDCGPFGDAGAALAGPPSAIAANPSFAFTDNDVLIADPAGDRVIACNSDGESCETFGETDEINSEYRDIFFAPPQLPSTTTTLSTTTTTLED